MRPLPPHPHRFRLCSNSRKGADTARNGPRLFPGRGSRRLPKTTFFGQASRRHQPKAMLRGTPASSVKGGPPHLTPHIASCLFRLARTTQTAFAIRIHPPPLPPAVRSGEQATFSKGRLPDCFVLPIPPPGSHPKKMFYVSVSTTFHARNKMGETERPARPPRNPYSKLGSVGFDQATLGSGGLGQRVAGVSHPKVGWALPTKEIITLRLEVALIAFLRLSERPTNFFFFYRPDLSVCWWMRAPRQRGRPALHSRGGDPKGIAARTAKGKEKTVDEGYPLTGWPGVESFSATMARGDPPSSHRVLPGD